MMKGFASAALWLPIFLIGCAGNTPRESPEVIAGADTTVTQIATEPETPPVVPINPRILEAELRITISNIRVLSGESLQKYNLSRGIPPAAPPQLYIWTPAIIQRPNQIIQDLQIEGPLPSDIFFEEENGNQIYFWNLTPLLGKQDEIILSRKVKVQASELFPVVDTSRVLAYDFSDRDYQFYTREEANIEITPEIRQLALQLAGAEPNPYKKARLLFDWVNANLRYQSPSPGRGAAAALRTRRGDSAQFSFLFIALCRAVGIPARLVTGFMAKTGAELVRHSWAEFLLPGHGWVPADPLMGAKSFARGTNRGFVAAVGQNIPLRHVPFWATYKNSEVENNRTPFMQLATVVSTGIRAHISSQIITLNFSEENAPLLSDQQIK